MKLSRRRFFGSGIGLFALGVTSRSASADASLKTVCSGRADAALNKPWHMVIAGRHGNRHRDSASLFDKEQSVITMVDLRSGDSKDAVIPVRNAHKVLVMPEHDRMVTPPQNFANTSVTDMDGKLIKNIKAPKEGYLFSGHGEMHPNGKSIMMTYYKEGTISDGSLAVYDAKDFSLLSTHSLDAIGPHDMALLPDGKTLAVASYGEPKLATMDDYSGRAELILVSLDDYTIQERLPCGEGIFGHLVAGDDNKVYGLIERYSPNEPDDKTSKAAIEKNVADLNKDPHFQLSQMDMREGGIAMPTPLVSFDLQAKKLQSYTAPDASTRRPLSLDYSSQTKKLLATYVHSNHLAVIDSDGKCAAFNSQDYFIENPSGVSAIPDSPYVVLSGTMVGVSLIDARDMKLVEHYPIHLYRTSHSTVYTV